MNPSESPNNNAAEQSEKRLGMKEGLRNAALSGAIVASMAQIASAEGASQAEVRSCLEDNAAQNIQMVTERFPELNQKIADYAEAVEQALGNLDREAARIASSDGEEVSEARSQNFAWIGQMVVYCEAELDKLEVEIAQADLAGLDTGELASRMVSLEDVIANLEEVRVAYRDM